MGWRIFFVMFCIAWPALPSATAAEYPKVLFGSLPLMQENEQSFEVTDSLLQLQVTPSLVISAGKGALFNLYPGPDNGFVLTVNGGAVIAMELDANQVVELPPGAYRIGVRQVSATEVAAAPDYKQGFSLADYVMVQQQTYLEKLRIDVKDINRGLAALLRGLFPGSH